MLESNIQDDQDMLHQDKIIEGLECHPKECGCYFSGIKETENYLNWDEL